MEQHPVVVIGAGAAGLGAAYELARDGVQPLVLEKGDRVGGLARTESHGAFRFDIGGHRFHTRVPEVEQIWQDMLGDQLLTVPRLSRVYYDGRFFKYPLQPLDTLRKLGFAASFQAVASYLRARLRPNPDEETLEHWLINRFGVRLYETFFKTYSEKVWGVPCADIGAEWAAQRIGKLSVAAVLRNALLGTRGPKTLIDEFLYPVLGPGMMWERFAEVVEEQEGQVRLKTEVSQLNRSDGRIDSLVAKQNGEAAEVQADHFISSMPLTELIVRLSPPAPPEVADAAAGLKHRALALVALVVARDDLFPDHWVYIQTAAVKVGRIQNFKNWSAAMVPNGGKTCLGLEYFCSEGDALWQTPDEDLLSLATVELDATGLGRRQDVVDGRVIRQPMAYPVYNGDYQRRVQVVREYLATFDNLQTIGRSGLHRYNNMDHSMLTGMIAARNVGRRQYDVWAIDPDHCPHEVFKPAARPSHSAQRPSAEENPA